jgi:hypothetical protein
MVDCTTAWIKTYKDPRRDLNGMPVTQTWELTQVGAETIERWASEEAVEKLGRVQQALQRRVKQMHAAASARPGETPPGSRDLTPVTDVNERGELVVIGYRLPD